MENRMHPNQKKNLPSKDLKAMYGKKYGFQRNHG